MEFQRHDMNTVPLLKLVLHQIRTAFTLGVPNGWILGWDERRFQSQLEKRAAPFTCMNHTSFDYAFCNLYIIECRNSSWDKHFTLTVRISFIADIFCIHWTEYDLEGLTGHVTSSAPHPELTALEQRVRTMLVGLALAELDHADLDLPVLGIALELSGERDVTISKCLFQDYEG